MHDLRDVIIRTALEPSAQRSEPLGRPVLLKREDLQRCRFSRVGGADTVIASLDAAERERGVCAPARVTRAKA